MNVEAVSYAEGPFGQCTDGVRRRWFAATPWLVSRGWQQGGRTNHVVQGNKANKAKATQSLLVRIRTSHAAYHQWHSCQHNHCWYSNAQSPCCIPTMAFAGKRTKPTPYTTNGIRTFTRHNESASQNHQYPRHKILQRNNSNQAG